MKKLILTLLSFALLPAQLCHAQLVRVSIPFPSISSQYSPLLQANIPPNSPVLAVCNSPANQVPCTNYATTYTSSGSACPNGAQDTPDPQPSACQATGDAQGNLGIWVHPGTYDYTVCVENTTFCDVPHTITVIGTASAQTGPRPTIANWHGWSWTGGTSTALSNAFAYGDSPNIAGNGQTNSSVSPTATDPAYYRINVNTSTASWGGIYSGGQTNESALFTLGILQYFSQKVRITIGGAERVFIGGYDGTQGTPLSSALPDTLAHSFVGFRYSTTASDTHWMAITNNGGTQTATDTGITPDTSAHVFAFTQSSSGATVNFFIDGTQVATVSTNVPSNSSVLRALNAIMATGNVSNNMDTAWVYWETNP